MISPELEHKIIDLARKILVRHVDPDKTSRENAEYAVLIATEFECSASRQFRSYDDV